MLVCVLENETGRERWKEGERVSRILNYYFHLLCPFAVGKGSF